MFALSTVSPTRSIAARPWVSSVSPAPASRATAMTIMGLISMPPGKIEGGDVRYRGRSILEMTEEEMQHIRGNDIAMIFQLPYDLLLNPGL